MQCSPRRNDFHQTVHFIGERAPRANVMDSRRRMRLTHAQGMDKKSIRIGIALTGLAVVAGASAMLYAGREPLSTTKAATGVAPSVQAGSEERLAALPSRQGIGKPRGEPFAPRSWTPVTSPLRKVAVAPPVAPPLPYRVAGQVTYDGGMRVVLARDDRVFTVREGETLDNLYRIESIRPDAVTFVYLPLDERQQVAVVGLRLEMATPAAPMTSANAAPATPAAAGATHLAYLRWEGPKQVKAGNDFEVALKLTSAQPVRTLPLQLEYDAKLLEPLAVRPGELFAEGRFTYRVNPNGSIFVGASAGVAAPTDADFVVVTFRSLRSGNAELRLSAVALQGAAGRAIAHESPAAFRTAIVQ